MVKELFMLARVAQQDRKLPGFRAQQWYFFFVATFYLYLRSAATRQQQKANPDQCSSVQQRYMQSLGHVCRNVAGLDDLRCIVTIIVLISTMLCFLTCAVQTVCCAGSSRTTCC
jgi:hypothetical protein